jgi:hypothetical protein
MINSDCVLLAVAIEGATAMQAALAEAWTRKERRDE